MEDDLGLKQQATDLFEQAHRRALWRSLWGRLKGRNAAVQCLSGEGSGTRGAGRHAGLQTVSVAQIRGSEGRCQGFDAEFGPLHGQDKRRWVDLCLAMLSGVVLPPIELIQVDDVYYVRDGHHRVSVARALGQEQIDAEVVRWE
jgi:hypothetical protein